MRILLFAGILFHLFMVENAAGQVHTSQNWELSFASTIGQSYHYYAPVQFITCIEGCPVKEQNPGFFESYQCMLNRRVGTSHFLGIGIGFSRYRFPTTYFDLFGQSTFERNRTLPFLTYSLQYSWYILQRKKMAIALRPGIAIEQYVEQEYVPYAPEFPMCATINLQLNGPILPGTFYTFGLSFRSSLSRYNEDNYLAAHFPFAYGINIGLSRHW